MSRSKTAPLSNYLIGVICAKPLSVYTYTLYSEIDARMTLRMDEILSAIKRFVRSF